MRDLVALGVIVAAAFVAILLPIGWRIKETWEPAMTWFVLVAGTVVVLTISLSWAWAYRHRAQALDVTEVVRMANTAVGLGGKALTHTQRAQAALPPPMPEMDIWPAMDRPGAYHDATVVSTEEDL